MLPPADSNTLPSFSQKGINTQEYTTTSVPGQKHEYSQFVSALNCHGLSTAFQNESKNYPSDRLNTFNTRDNIWTQVPDLSKFNCSPEVLYALNSLNTPLGSYLYNPNASFGNNAGNSATQNPDVDLIQNTLENTAASLISNNLQESFHEHSPSQSFDMKSSITSCYTDAQIVEIQHLIRLSQKLLGEAIDEQTQPTINDLAFPPPCFYSYSDNSYYGPSDFTPDMQNFENQYFVESNSYMTPVQQNEMVVLMPSEFPSIPQFPFVIDDIEDPETENFSDFCCTITGNSQVQSFYQFGNGLPAYNTPENTSPVSFYDYVSTLDPFSNQGVHSIIPNDQDSKFSLTNQSAVSTFPSHLTRRNAISGSGTAAGFRSFGSPSKSVSHGISKKSQKARPHNSSPVSMFSSFEKLNPKYSSNPRATFSGETNGFKSTYSNSYKFYNFSFDNSGLNSSSSNLASDQSIDTGPYSSFNAAQSAQNLVLERSVDMKNYPATFQTRVENELKLITAQKPQEYLKGDEVVVDAKGINICGSNNAGKQNTNHLVNTEQPLVDKPITASCRTSYTSENKTMASVSTPLKYNTQLNDLAKPGLDKYDSDYEFFQKPRLIETAKTLQTTTDSSQNNQICQQVQVYETHQPNNVDQLVSTKHENGSNDAVQYASKVVEEYLGKDMRTLDTNLSLIDPELISQTNTKTSHETSDTNFSSTFVNISKANTKENNNFLNLPYINKQPLSSISEDSPTLEPKSLKSLKSFANRQTLSAKASSLLSTKVSSLLYTKTQASPATPTLTKTTTSTESVTSAKSSAIGSEVALVASKAVLKVKRKLGITKSKHDGEIEADIKKN